LRDVGGDSKEFGFKNIVPSLFWAFGRAAWPELPCPEFAEKRPTGEIFSSATHFPPIDYDQKQAPVNPVATPLFSLPSRFPPKIAPKTCLKCLRKVGTLLAGVGTWYEFCAAECDPETPNWQATGFPT
jgi:hypothetical protein